MRKLDSRTKSERWKALPLQTRIRHHARKDFQRIYGPNSFVSPKAAHSKSHSRVLQFRVPRGELLDEFARTFGTPQFDLERFYRYAKGEKVKTPSEERIVALAREYQVPQRLVRAILANWSHEPMRKREYQ